MTLGYFISFFSNFDIVASISIILFLKMNFLPQREIFRYGDFII